MGQPGGGGGSVEPSAGVVVETKGGGGLLALGKQVLMSLWALLVLWLVVGILCSLWGLVLPLPLVPGV